MRIGRSLGTAGLVALIAACSGGDSDDDDGFGSPPAYTVDAAAFNADGDEPELDLSDSDAVLAAALAAAETAGALVVGDLADADDGAPPPGRGLFPCSAGSISESVAVDAVSGERRLTLRASQCFDGGSDDVQEGVSELRYTLPAAGQAQGTRSYGSGAAPFLFALPDPDGGDYRFGQALGTLAFDGEFDGSPSHSVASGFALVIGKGPRPFGAAAMTPDRQMDVRAGAPGFELDVASSSGGGNELLQVSGRLFVAGSGAALEPACAFEARFDVGTGRTLRVGDGDDVIRDGLLTLDTSAGTATVEFGADGSARVDTGSGAPRIYPAGEVRSFCGL